MKKRYIPPYSNGKKRVSKTPGSTPLKRDMWVRVPPGVLIFDRKESFKYGIHLSD